MSPAGVGRSADKRCSYESEQREGRRTAGDSGGQQGTAGRELRPFEDLQPRGYSEGEGRGMELQAASGRAVRYSNTPSSLQFTTLSEGLENYYKCGKRC